MLSVVGALLAVATPLLAGQVVNLIFAAAPFAQVLLIAIAIAVIADRRGRARSAAALAVRPAR